MTINTGDHDLRFEAWGRSNMVGCSTCYCRPSLLATEKQKMNTISKRYGIYTSIPISGHAIATAVNKAFIWLYRSKAAATVYAFE